MTKYSFKVQGFKVQSEYGYGTVQKFDWIHPTLNLEPLNL